MSELQIEYKIFEERFANLLDIFIQDFRAKNNDPAYIEFQNGVWLWIEQKLKEACKEQRENDFDKIIKGLTVFTEKPIGTIEGDVCDWNKPSVFAYNYSPAELQNKVVKRIKDVLSELKGEKCT